MLIIYNILIYTVLIIGLPVWLPYVLISGKRRRTVLYRLQVKSPAGLKTPRKGPGAAQPVIWIHALSVGEVISALPLIDVLERRFDGRIVFSAATLTGFHTACERLQDRVAGIVYAPYDLRFAIRRALERIRPSIAVIVETDAWPNMIDCLRQSGTPVLMVNARLSDRSLKGYRRFRFLTALIFARLTRICTQTEEDAVRFGQLGVPENRLAVTGNLKFDQTYPAVPDSEKEGLKRQLGLQQRARIIVAGSTHEGEEAIIAAAFLQLKKDHPDLAWVNAPRHPVRSAELVRYFADTGLKSRLWTTMNTSTPNPQADVIVIDTIGLLVKLYAICDIAIVGGSLLDIRGIGGHNPLEPAAFAKPIIFGHNMRNFRQIAGMLESSDAALVVADATELSGALQSLLENPPYARETGMRANRVFNANKGAVTRTADVMLELLDASSPL